MAIGQLKPSAEVGVGWDGAQSRLQDGICQSLGEEPLLRGILVSLIALWKSTPGEMSTLAFEICSGGEVGRDTSLLCTINAHDRSLRYLWFTNNTERESLRNSPNSSFRQEEAFTAGSREWTRSQAEPIPLLLSLSLLSL